MVLFICSPGLPILALRTLFFSSRICCAVIAKINFFRSIEPNRQLSSQDVLLGARNRLTVSFSPNFLFYWVFSTSSSLPRRCLAFLSSCTHRAVSNMNETFLFNVTEFVNSDASHLLFIRAHCRHWKFNRKTTKMTFDIISNKLFDFFHHPRIMTRSFPSIFFLLFKDTFFSQDVCFD